MMDPNQQTGQPLVRLLFIGLLAWLIGSITAIVWFFSSVPDPGLAGVAFPFYAWLIGYFPAGVLLLIVSVIQRLRQKVTTKIVVWAVFIYFMPVLFELVLYKIFLSLQPLAVQEGDEPMMAVAFGGPSFFGLYFVGLLLGFLFRKEPLRKTIFAMVAPPVGGICLSVVGFLVFTFTSSHWKHRDAFELNVQAVRWSDPKGLSVEATLKVSENLTGVMHAYYQDEQGESRRGHPIDSLQIDSTVYSKSSWTQTPVQFRQGETYRLRFVWRGLTTTSLQTKREVVFRITEGPYYFAGPLLIEEQIPVNPDAQTLAALEARLSTFSQGGRMGYRNKAEKVIIEPQFDWADEFSEDRAVVRVDGKFGYIDQMGRAVIDVRYDYATRFSDGLAGVTFRRRTRNEAGYIDRDGNVAIPFDFDAAHAFSSGRARVRLNGKDGYIDRVGTMVIAPQWEWAEDFSDGMAAVRVGEKWGFMDTTGAMVIPPKFDAFQKFEHGYASVMLGNQWGYVDKQGNWKKERE